MHVCVDLHSNYTCSCFDGFFGRNCSDMIETTSNGTMTSFTKNMTETTLGASQVSDSTSPMASQGQMTHVMKSTATSEAMKRTTAQQTTTATPPATTTTTSPFGISTASKTSKTISSTSEKNAFTREAMRQTSDHAGSVGTSSGLQTIASEEGTTQMSATTAGQKKSTDVQETSAWTSRQAESTETLTSSKVYSTTAVSRNTRVPSLETRRSSLSGSTAGILSSTEPTSIANTTNQTPSTENIIGNTAKATSDTKQSTSDLKSDPYVPTTSKGYDLTKDFTIQDKYATTNALLNVTHTTQSSDGSGDTSDTIAGGLSTKSGTGVTSQSTATSSLELQNNNNNGGSSVVSFMTSTPFIAGTSGGAIFILLVIILIVVLVKRRRPGGKHNHIDDRCRCSAGNEPITLNNPIYDSTSKV